jgi:polysaccharide export outer membrane protein
VLFLVSACATKKKLLYFQDSESYVNTPIAYSPSTIQVNDILDVKIGALVPEMAVPYNKSVGSNTQIIQNIELIKLSGYMVTLKGFIRLPILGDISVMGETIANIETAIVAILEEGGHLINPTVTVRLLNAKVTILGEVKMPGTYSFTEQFITLPQALGYAGDLTINGERKGVVLIREVDGTRSITKIDLTSANWMNSSEYAIKPNDVIVVNPNQVKVKSAGYVGSVSTVLSILSLLLSTTILLTR